MRTRSLALQTIVGGMVLCVFALPAKQLTAQEIPAQNPPAEEAILRGEYLVHHVAMCVQCHSPRTDDGKLIANQLLTGGKINVNRPFANQPWALKAPRLAGLPGFIPDEIVTLLVRGRRDDGGSPRPPMPPFRLTTSDAEAIVAYLQSLR